eukprot:CAMPEP_0168536308 /NCGR_PEP_ID=MMETSP0405-20121227/19454_1 /TAXON_ID=498012 /ORGANISM="Trichosphaerium sp, Strain Am-I-7 wt" /LENGTH=110 /DNA_ID=CAMNT_0008564253 /DNA_START=158 /DNA_END=487 /DNA_ORIENTATION=-
MKRRGTLCSFSPCIEQVQQTVVKLEELGFKDISTLECIVRPFDVQSHGWMKIALNADEEAELLAKKEELKERKRKRKRSINPEGNVYTKPVPMIRSHTGFLTFASLCKQP